MYTSETMPKAGKRASPTTENPRAPRGVTPAAPRGPLGALPIRNRILAAAAVAFAQHGAAGTTVEHLLQAAGVSRRTYYRFFASKDDALDALHEQAIALFLAASRAALATPGDAETKVRRCIETYLRFGRESGGLMLVLAGEAQRAGTPLAARRQATVDAMVGLLADAVRPSGDEARVDATLLRGLVIALDGITRHLLESGRPTDEDFARAEAAMLRIVLATLQAKDTSLPALPQEPGAARAR